MVNSMSVLHPYGMTRYYFICAVTLILMCSERQVGDLLSFVSVHLSTSDAFCCAASVTSATGLHAVIANRQLIIVKKVVYTTTGLTRSRFCSQQMYVQERGFNP